MAQSSGIVYYLQTEPLVEWFYCLIHLSIEGFSSSLWLLTKLHNLKPCMHRLLN